MKHTVFTRCFSVLFVCALLLTATACGSQDTPAENAETSAPSATAAPEATASAEAEDGAQVTPDPAITQTKVLVTMEDGQTFTIQCYPEYAPQTCANFLKLVSEGFYDGLTFHRVLDDFVAQGGDPKGNGTGGSDQTIPGEFSSNGFTQNTLQHKRGVVAMARSNDPDSASSQFYICYTDLPHLDGDYAAFGEVIDGMQTVDSFLEVERDQNGMPQTPITIKTMELID